MFHQNNPSEGPDRSDLLDQFLQSRINEIRIYARVLTSESNLSELDDSTSDIEPDEILSDIPLRAMELANEQFGAGTFSLGIGEDGEALLIVKNPQNDSPEAQQVQRIHSQMRDVIAVADKVSSPNNSFIYIEQQENGLATVFTLVKINIPGANQNLLAIAKDYNVRILSGEGIRDNDFTSQKLMKSLSSTLRHEDPLITEGTVNVLVSDNLADIKERLLSFCEKDGKRWCIELTDKSHREVLIEVVGLEGEPSEVHCYYTEVYNSDVQGMPLSLDFMNINLLTEVSPADRTKFEQTLNSFSMCLSQVTDSHA